MTLTSVSDYIEYGTRILTNLLLESEDAKVKIPSINYVEEMKALVRNKHPLLENVWCTMDGLKLMIECSSNEDEQNNYYNGWTSDQHYVKSVLAFCPDGAIRICCYDIPGSVHDSTIADIGGIYRKLEAVYEECQGMCTVESAFARKNHPFLMKSGKQNVDLNRMQPVSRMGDESLSIVIFPCEG